MGKYTSNELQKVIKKLEYDKTTEVQMINQNSEFVASLNEDVNQLMAENKFNIQESVERIEIIDKKIMAIKHAKNIFNSTYKLPCGLTIDEALIKIAMINSMLSRYRNLSEKKEKTRNKMTLSKEVEYVYTTYDINYMRKKSDEMFEELQTIQNELNSVNAYEYIEIDAKI